MSDPDSAETIVSTDVLAHALELEIGDISDLTRLGILRPVHVSEISQTSEHRYEFLESLRSYLRHLRVGYGNEN